MSDWPFDPSAIPEELPPSRPLDLEQAGEQAALIQPTGTVVLLLSGARDRVWAARAAVALCAAWAEQGRRTVLADLHFEVPLLDEHAAGQMEGVVDAFLYGASLSRVARPAPSGGYYVIPAGTYTPDAREVFTHSRWPKLVAGFRDTDAVLLLFAPAENQDLPALGAWASEAILLGSSLRTGVDVRLQEAGVRTIAVLTPTAEQAASLMIVPESEEDVVSLANGSNMDVDAEASNGSTEAVAPDGGATGELPPRRSQKPRRKSLHPALIALLFAVLLGAALLFSLVLVPQASPQTDQPGSAETSFAVLGEERVHSARVTSTLPRGRIHAAGSPTLSP